MEEREENVDWDSLYLFGSKAKSIFPFFFSC